MLRRSELATKYGIKQVTFAAFEDGVVEFGTTRGTNAEDWTGPPPVPVLPKKVMRHAFEELGALYVLFWEKQGDVYRVAADYEVAASINSRVRRRSDGQSFISASRQLDLPAEGAGPVATAVRLGEEVVVGFGYDCGTIAAEKMKRAAVAKEFDIKTIHFVPFEGGVIEYGVTSAASLNDVTLDATLKMQCEATGAGYGIYWAEQDGEAVVADRYVTPGHAAELKASGKRLSFAEASQATVMRADGNSPVAEVLRSRQPVLIEDAQSCVRDGRSAAATEYGIQSICYVPVLGGVLEYGTTEGDCTADWESMADARPDALPKAELEQAIRSGATYAIYWQRHEAQKTYTMAGSFETAGGIKSEKGSYVENSARLTLDMNGLGPIGLAGSSGTKIVVADTKADANFKRSKLAQSWGIGSITCVPCDDGVLEYGTANADKRKDAFGQEYQEATRPYRRTVFVHDDWKAHRSPERFQKSIKSLPTSGILRARYQEVAGTAAIATATVLWNILASGYTDFDGVKEAALIEHLPTAAIPISLFTLTSPSLGLLLVFRTNTCYARWDDSRKIWGDIINKCRSVVRQGNTFMRDEYPGYGQFQDWRRRIAAETSAFTRCLRCFLRGKEDDTNLRYELKNLGFTASEVDGYMNSANRQAYALQMLGISIRKADLDPRDRANMDEMLSKLCDDVGACERIFKTPIPLVYTRHLSRFVGTWLGLLPLAIWGVDPSWNHFLTIPSCALITFFLIGVEELGLQIEEPFSILPLEAFCDASIGNVLTEMVLSEDKARAMDKKQAEELSVSGSIKPSGAKAPAATL